MLRQARVCLVLVLFSTVASSAQAESGRGALPAAGSAADVAMQEAVSLARKQDWEGAAAAMTTVIFNGLQRYAAAAPAGRTT